MAKRKKIQGKLLKTAEIMPFWRIMKGIKNNFKEKNNG
jgi:hypothetical protein